MKIKLTWEELNELNNKSRNKLTKQSAIQIRRTYEDSTVAGKFINVEYVDYGIRCEDSAPLDDIIDYLKYGEKYITNIGALVKYCSNSVEPAKSSDELAKSYIEIGKQKLRGQDRKELLEALDRMGTTDDHEMPYGWEKAKQKVESLGGTVMQISEDKLQIKLNGEVNWYPPAYIINRL